MNAKVNMKLSEVKLQSIAFVYSGKAHACCCGCAGKYRYASAHQAWGTQNRGYSVDAEDINDRFVKTVYNKMVKAEATGETEYNGDGLWVFETETHLYMAKIAA